MRYFVPLLLLATAPAFADPPADAEVIAPADALACVAARYMGDPLRLEQEDDGRLYELRWRTPAGNVLRIDVTGPGCRFIDVQGVGQTEALIRAPRTD